MGKCVVREGEQEKRQEREDVSQGLTLKFGMVVRRLFENMQLEKKVGRSWPVVFDGRKYDCTLELKVSDRGPA